MKFVVCLFVCLFVCRCNLTSLVCLLLALLLLLSMVDDLLQISLLHTPAPFRSCSIIAPVYHQAWGKGGVIVVAVSGSARRSPLRTPMAMNQIPVGAVVVEDDRD